MMRHASIYRLRVVAALLGSLCLATLSAACQDESAPAPAQAEASGYAAAPGSFRDDQGRTITVERRDGYGYTLRDASGTKVGKVKVEADRVKVKDQSDTLVAKVKRKDDGFKLYDGSDVVVFRGRQRDNLLRLRTEAGAEVARLPWGDARALDTIAGTTAHQRLALAIYLADVGQR